MTDAVSGVFAYRISHEVLAEFFPLFARLFLHPCVLYQGGGAISCDLSNDFCLFFFSSTWLIVSWAVFIVSQLYSSSACWVRCHCLAVHNWLSPLCALLCQGSRLGCVWFASGTYCWFTFIVLLFRSGDDWGKILEKSCIEIKPCSYWNPVLAREVTSKNFTESCNSLRSLGWRYPQRERVKCVWVLRRWLVGEDCWQKKRCSWSTRVVKSFWK